MHKHTYTHTHTNQNLGQVMTKVLKSTTRTFVAGESSSLKTGGTTASMYRVHLATSAIALTTPAATTTTTTQAVPASSAVFPANLAAQLSLSSAVNVDVVIHASVQAPIIAGVVPVTPLVGLTLSRADSTGTLNVSGLSQGINITLPVTATSVPAYRDGLVFSGKYECMYWNGEVYSTQGCRAADDQVPGLVKCTCTHLTEFIAQVIHLCVFVYMYVCTSVRTAGA
jgi:hypothetical protein